MPALSVTLLSRRLTLPRPLRSLVGSLLSRFWSSHRDGVHCRGVASSTHCFLCVGGVSCRPDTVFSPGAKLSQTQLGMCRLPAHPNSISEMRGVLSGPLEV